MSGRLVYCMGPSGAGKDSLFDWLRQHLPASGAVHWARRTISRPAPAGGEAHESVDDATFARLRDAQAFALHWQANGLHYGVRHAELEPLSRRAWVLVNGSRAYLPQALQQCPQLVAVHITASPEVLRQPDGPQPRDGRTDRSTGAAGSGLSAATPRCRRASAQRQCPGRRGPPPAAHIAAAARLAPVNHAIAIALSP